MCNTATGATVAEVPELRRMGTGATVAGLPELWNAATGANVERMYRDRTRRGALAADVMPTGRLTRPTTPEHDPARSRPESQTVQHNRTLAPTRRHACRVFPNLVSLVRFQPGAPHARSISARGRPESGSWRGVRCGLPVGTWNWRIDVRDPAGTCGGRSSAPAVVDENGLCPSLLTSANRHELGEIMNAFIYLLYLAITVYAWLIVGRALLSWLRPTPGSVLFRIDRLLYRVTEPPSASSAACCRRPGSARSASTSALWWRCSSCSSRCRSWRDSSAARESPAGRPGCPPSSQARLRARRDCG